MTGFVGDVGGAHNSAGIFKASDNFFGADFILGSLVRCSAVIVLLMLVALIFVLARAAVPSIRQFGLKFLVTSRWSPEHDETARDANGNVKRDEDGDVVKITVPGQFGALPVIYGTVVTSAIALLIAVPLSLGASLFLVRIGPWLAPTFVKYGILGMLLTGYLMLLSSSHGALIFAGIGIGVGLTCLLLWIAWQYDDPRVGRRWELELPAHFGAFLLGMLLIHAAGSGWGAGFVGGILITGMLHFLAPSIVAIISFLIEFLAAIPSIAYGVWGLFVVVPFLQAHLEPPLNSFFGLIPFLRFLHTSDYPSGRDMFCAGLILGIMVLPIITAISRDVLRAVPRIQIEGTQALGATWWQSSWAMLRYGRSGLFGAIMLGLARAAGETMAVAMVIGNAVQIRSSVFKAAQTMSSLLANEFAEASTDMHRSALVEVALILLLMSLVFNVAARYLVVGGQVRATG